MILKGNNRQKRALNAPIKGTKHSEEVASAPHAPPHPPGTPLSSIHSIIVY